MSSSRNRWFTEEFIFTVFMGISTLLFIASLIIMSVTPSRFAAIGVLVFFVLAFFAPLIRIGLFSVAEAKLHRRVGAVVLRYVKMVAGLLSVFMCSAWRFVMGEKHDRVRELLDEALSTNNHRHLPAVHPPSQQLIQYALARRRGFFVRLFNPHEAIVERESLARFRIEQETMTELLKLDAQLTLELKNLQGDGIKADFADEQARGLELAKLERAGETALTKHLIFQKLLGQTQYIRDPVQREAAEAALYDLFFGENKS